MKKVYSFFLILVAGVAIAVVVTAFNNPSGNPPTGGGALTVDSGLNVGIGKTPSYKLDVNGIINGTALYVGGAPYVGSQWTTSGSNIYYNTGNVGIGTAAPGAKLEVAGDFLITNTKPMITLNGFGGSSKISEGATAIGSPLNISTDGNRNILVMPGGTGNVGIGTTGPGTKLDVSGTARMTGFQLGTSATAGYVLTTDASGVGTWQAVSALPSGTSGQTLRHNGTTWVANSVIYNDGTNVGIGTASPGSNKLAIAGGNLDLGGNNITGVNKLTVNSIDPVFMIGGQQYVTYVPDTIGQKVEVVGQAQLANGELKIDLSQQKENSDLWLFYNIIKPETIIPLVSSQSSASLYAYMDGANLVVKLKDGDPQAKFSYQLTASRIDQKTDYLIPETKSEVYIDVDSLKK